MVPVVEGEDPHADLILAFAKDRALAHQALFRHRHPDATPKFHEDIIDLWHDPTPGSRALLMCFREAAKSTLAEEAIVIMAALRSFRNAVILGENQPRAIDRLAAIKHEILTNEFLINLFGTLQDDAKWNEAKIILKNGVCIQALGRGQEVRGMKHLDIRPDFCFADDVEGKEHVRDAAARKETLQWFFAEVIPALDKKARVRVNATPLDTDSLPMQLLKLPSWQHRRFPIKYLNADGGWDSTWPERYPLPWIEAKESEMRRLGLHHEFMREYMCEPDDPAKKIFTDGMFKVEPRVHVWQPTLAFYDPARTIKDGSSTTGWAVWSWIGVRLIVWDGGGERWLPDQLIDHIFKINDQYRPVMIGVEKDGLEEFVQQPLRQAMAQRGVLLPLVPVSAPKGKLDFIGSLQPFFQSGEVTFAKELSDLKAQFLNFPTGAIDAPNALAYALRMRPGLVVYEDFTARHVVESIPVHDRVPIWLALNATRGLTTGILVQIVQGAVHILKDWVMEGDPGATLKDIVKEAKLEAQSDVRLVAPRRHFYDFDTVGLRGATVRLPSELRQGGDENDGRAEIRSLLKQYIKDMPALTLAHLAHWTINAFAAGYAREVGKDGIVRQEAREGIYRVLMEGLEGFAALLRLDSDLDAGVKPNYAWTDTGQRYKTILPQRQEVRDEKSAWLGVGVGAAALRKG